MIINFLADTTTKVVEEIPNKVVETPVIDGIRDIIAEPNKYLKMAETVGVKLLWAIGILLIGRLIVKLIVAGSCKAMRKSKVDETIVKFAHSLIGFIGMVFVFIAALAKLGIPTASMVAAVGAIGLAIGLALQGALGNFASGILIVTFRPFKVNDLVEISGEVGTVREIDLFTTKIITPNNKTLIIPNGAVTSGTIMNFTETEDLRVDLTFGIGYRDDIDHAKSVLQSILDADERVLKNPEAFIGVVEHGESSINLVCRPWVKAPNYWGVFFDTNENVKKAFDKEGISIPFPQRDIHIISQPEK